MSRENAEPPFIVAEISKNWLNGASGDSLLICQKFELVIETNRARGYILHSFQLNRLMTGPLSMNETIIAVFQRQLT